MDPNNASRMVGGIDVLLIEDNATDAFLVRRSLTSVEGTEVFVENVARLDSALMILRLRRFDAVILDVSSGDGLDKLEKLLTRGPQIPVVVIGDEHLNARAEKALALGASGYLLKDEVASPLLGTALVAAIEKNRQLAMARRAAG